MKLPNHQSQEYHDLLEYVCLLRYKTRQPSTNNPTYLSLPTIRGIVGYSETTIRELCKKSIQLTHSSNNKAPKNTMDSFVIR